MPDVFELMLLFRQWINSKNSQLWTPAFQTLEPRFEPYLQNGDVVFGAFYTLFAMFRAPSFSIDRAISFLQQHPDCDPLDLAVFYDMPQDDLDKIAYEQLRLLRRIRQLERLQLFPKAVWKDGFLISDGTLLSVVPQGSSLVIPDVRRIDTYALTLYPEPLERISIPAQLEYCGLAGIIQEHDSISDITVRPGENKAFMSFDGILYSTKHHLVCCPPARKTAVSVEVGTQIIDVDAFQNCTHVESITLPDGLEHILWGAFWGCTGLMSLRFPKSLLTIWGFAFEGCHRLQKVTFLGGDVELDEQVFDQETDVTIVAPPGSTVERFAIENGYRFEALPDAP